MARQQIDIIYVPGIHDDIYHAQSLMLIPWRLFGVRGHCHVMPWLGKQSYEPKLQSLHEEVNSYRAQNHRVFLVGASAGASAVLNLYAEHPSELAGVALICPKLSHPETVRAAIYEANPAFQTALTILQPNLGLLGRREKARMAIYYSPKDGVIPYEDSSLPGVKEYSLPPVRHGFAILYAITFGAFRLCTRLKALPA